MIRKFFGYLALAINTALGIIALGVIARSIVYLFNLGWRLF